MFIYGGYDQHGFCCDELYQFSFFSTLWKKVKTRLHSSSYMWLWCSSRLLLLLHLRNISFWKTKVKTTKDPNCGQLERYHHSAVAFGRSMFIFGGKGVYQGLITNSLFNQSDLLLLRSASKLLQRSHWVSFRYVERSFAPRWSELTFLIFFICMRRRQIRINGRWLRRVLEQRQAVAGDTALWWWTDTCIYSAGVMAPTILQTCTNMTLVCYSRWWTPFMCSRTRQLR